MTAGFRTAPGGGTPMATNATVGRIVHYYDGEDVRPQAAIVTATGDQTVDLAVISPEGTGYRVTFVFQSQEPGVAGYWNWPPRV